MFRASSRCAATAKMLLTTTYRHQQTLNPLVRFSFPNQYSLLQPVQFRAFAVSSNPDDVPPEKKTRIRAKKTPMATEEAAGEIAKPKRVRKSKTSEANETPEKA